MRSLDIWRPPQVTESWPCVCLSDLLEAAAGLNNYSTALSEQNDNPNGRVIKMLLEYFKILKTIRQIRKGFKNCSEYIPTWCSPRNWMLPCNMMFCYKMIRLRSPP